MKISFLGAAQTVTGSKHLIQLKSGDKVLLDCGMFQGMGAEADELNRKLLTDPSRIQHIILSHAHIDHSGLLPFFVKHGFKGKIYATPATIDLCEIMLFDSAHIQMGDINFINKRRERQHKSKLEVLYKTEDVEACLELFVPVEYHQPYKISEHFSFTFTDAGHIIGSAVTNIVINEDRYEKRICYTADIGRPDPPIISPPEIFPQCDYLICESTYGNRRHEDRKMCDERLLKIVVETCVMKRGKLIIPAFSIGRTQELVFLLDKLETEGRLPNNIPVYVDSPLSTNATYIVKRYPSLFNEELKRYMNEEDPHPFSFDRLQYIRDSETSKKLNQSKEPCIIISASGMADAGRVKHHIKNNIEDARNTILIVGYCEPNSLGARLMNDEPVVRIFGDLYRKSALIETMHSFSAHADYIEMLNFLACQDANHIKKTFLVHGDLEAQQAFREKLEQRGFKHVEIPRIGEGFEL
ncbi:MAG: MBL fold metallo-hydrolase RNA specificity domain-containing protein [Flavobacteriales bacterium]